MDRGLGWDGLCSWLFRWRPGQSEPRSRSMGLQHPSVARMEPSRVVQVLCPDPREGCIWPLSAPFAGKSTREPRRGAASRSLGIGMCLLANAGVGVRQSIWQTTPMPIETRSPDTVGPPRARRRPLLARRSERVEGPSERVACGAVRGHGGVEGASLVESRPASTMTTATRQ